MRVTGRGIESGVMFRAGRRFAAWKLGQIDCVTEKERCAMDAHCLKCGMVLASAWSFCPQCGSAVAHEAQVSGIHIPVPSKGAFSGMYIGLIAAPVLIISGVMLCLTGWGVFFGVPFILLGILAPLYGPIVGMGEHRGKCPSCGTRMISIADSKEHECPVCNKKFAIDEHTPAPVR